jgi:probable HAF family extracellular repeat protein
MERRPRSALTTLHFVAGFALLSTIANAQNLLTDIGPGTAFGINNSGQVVLQNGLYSNGTVTAFPTGFTGSAINGGGVVAGGLTGPNIAEACATYSNGTVVNLGVLSGDQDVDTCIATGINASGQVVGWSETKGGAAIEAVISSNGGMLTAITGFSTGPSLQLVSNAFGINDSGLVTGFAYKNSTNTYDAFIYDDGSGLWTDLGPGEGNAINASGHVVGSNAAGSFIYGNGTLTLIPISAVAINVTGQVVGSHFFYSGGIVDLNTLVTSADPLKPFVTLTSAVGINDHLMIVVNGVDSRTQLPHAYLVQAPSITISPGPLTFASQAIGTLSLGQVAIISNAGTTLLPIDSISASHDFSQTNNCGPSLTLGGSCSVTVIFEPTAAGDRTGSLIVTTTGVPVVVPLAGTAPINAEISSSATTAMAGTPVNLTWTASPGASCMATGGSATDGWIGNIAVGGTQSVAESSAGNYLYGLSCTAGSQSASSQVSVSVTWPPVTVSLTALPATFTAGQSIMLTWSSANASSCSATGGGAGGLWSGAKTTSGSTTLTEPYAPATPSLTLTYTLTCSSSASGLSASASAIVVEKAVVPPATKSGGGALDMWLIEFLASIAVLGRFRLIGPSRGSRCTRATGSAFGSNQRAKFRAIASCNH